MRILIVIPYFMPAISYGGPVRVAFDIARGLVSRGHEVTVATSDVFDDKSRVRLTQEVIDGISVIRFRNLSNALAKRMNGYLPLLFIPWIMKNGKNFDVIYCHDFFSLQTISAGYVGRFCNIPLLIQPHGSLSPVRRAAKFSFMKKALITLFGGILGGAKHIIALTEEEKEAIAAIAGNESGKIVIVPNGIDPDSFLNITSIDLHQRYEIPVDHRVIGFIGRLAYIKGLDISLEVLATLKDKHRFTFLIIGPDEGEMVRLKQQAEALGIRERVVFAGILSGEDKLRVIRSCDLFLFTSRDEGLPMTVLEVAALGVPQVISHECHVPEVAAYRAGYVHPCDDIRGFAGSIELLLSGRCDGPAMGENARRMVRECFSTGKVIDRIENLLV